MIFYDIDLCIGIDNQGSAITVKCCDTGVNIRAHLYVCRHGKWRDTHEAYSIPAGCVPVLKIAKPDNTFFVKDGKVEGSAVVFDTKPQAFTAAGTATAEVSLYAETGERITTATFSIKIPPECTSKCEGESGNYVDVMSEQIRVAVEAAEKAENAVTHEPIIQGDTWWVWDFEAGEYVDTGTSAASGVGKRTDDGGEIFGDYDHNLATAMFAAAFGSFVEAGWRSLAGGFMSRANNTSFSFGRLQNAEGKGAFCTGVELSVDVLKKDGSLVVTAEPISIDAVTFKLDAAVEALVGDLIHLAPVDMPDIKATDVRRVESVETVDGCTVVTIDVPFRQSNFCEGNGVPEDGYLPAGMKLKFDVGNVASGAGSAVLGGKGNKATAANAVVMGEESWAAAWNTLVSGWGLKASSAGQTVFGQWNEIDAAGLYALILGWGTKSDPKNVFTVERKGNVKAAGKFTAGKDPESNMDLVTLRYLNNLKDSGELTGPQGPVGPQGPKGEKGDPGEPGPAEIFIAEYGVTPFAEVKAAYDAGKALFYREGNYFAPLFQKTSGGSYSFYRHDTNNLTNAYCSSSGWGKKVTALCDKALGDIETALDAIIAIQNELIGGDSA